MPIIGSKITIIGEQSGLYVLVRVYTRHTEQWLMDGAARNGVKVYPTSPYFFSSAREPLLQLCFSNLTFEQIEEGIKTIKKLGNSFKNTEKSCAVNQRHSSNNLKGSLFFPLFSTSTLASDKPSYVN
ncbi:hypothetical protein EEX84_09860 [Planococcus salinus]|uniref:Aminotransferase class I/II-fold pyridoxal phosphate-dependent enzyme n=1 Tax=Planococcus salinus TaxID=1848460 RepID=A0A3M8P7Y6_9BACL|nr:hypothetical protein EEX84_09860 [Planococcus salinus]